MKSRPSANGYFQLADFAYRAGQVESGDRAAKEAVRRTPSDQRNTVRSLIKDTKKQGAQIAKALEGGQEGRAPAAEGRRSGRRARPELRPAARGRRDRAAGLAVAAKHAPRPYL